MIGRSGALSRQRRRYAPEAKLGQASRGYDSAFPLRGSIGSKFSQRVFGSIVAPDPLLVRTGQPNCRNADA